MDYVIGLIDEEKEQLSTIRRTFLVNPWPNNRLSFKMYDLSGSYDTLSDSIVDEVIQDIVNNRIQTLIVDYKIMIQSALLEGTDIYKSILDVVPKFPVVMLTDVPDNCYEKKFVDADKIYLKSAFFKIEESYSKEKVQNIYRNMERYVSLKAESSAKVMDALSKLEVNGFSPEIYKELLDEEKALDDLSPQGQTSIDKAFCFEDIKEAVELIERAEKLIGGDNEG